MMILFIQVIMTNGWRTFMSNDTYLKKQNAPTK